MAPLKLRLRTQRERERERERMKFGKNLQIENQEATGSHASRIGLQSASVSVFPNNHYMPLLKLLIHILLSPKMFNSWAPVPLRFVSSTWASSNAPMSIDVYSSSALASAEDEVVNIYNLCPISCGVGTKQTNLSGWLRMVPCLQPGGEERILLQWNIYSGQWAIGNI